MLYITSSRLIYFITRSFYYHCTFFHGTETHSQCGTTKVVPLDVPDETSCHSDLQINPQIFIISNVLLIGTESWSLNMNPRLSRITMCIIDQTYTLPS